MLAPSCAATLLLGPHLLPPPRAAPRALFDPPASRGGGDAEGSAEDLKRSILAQVSKASPYYSVPELVAALEARGLDDDLGARPAASPLLEGDWETLWVSEPPRWTRRWPLRRAQRLTHVIRGGWTGLEPGHYVQRVGGGLLRGECTAQWSELGGEAWSVGWRSCRLTLLGLRVWRHDALRADADFDYDVRPTFVDGDLCVLRSPAVVAGACELRAGRIYVLRRLRHRLWNGDGFLPPPRWLSGGIE